MSAAPTITWCSVPCMWHSDISRSITSIGLLEVPWIYAEQPIGRHLTLLVGCSHAFVRNSACQDFMGVGVHCRWDKLQVGVFSDCATFGERGESATEITCKIPFSEHLHLQPTIHLITNQGTLRSVATLRMAATL